MSRPILILVPPSEAKVAGGEGPKWAGGTSRFDRLDRPRRAVMAALRSTMSHDPGALLGVKGDPLAVAIAANRAVRRSPTMPAIERYCGVLYQALDAATLPAGAWRRLDERVVIVSGLLGASAPRDPIPAYKVKMGASLPTIGKLSTFWRPHLDAALAPAAADATVWDLLPNEHSSAWSGGGARRIVVRFLDDVERGGERRLVTVSHWNKLLKGSLVRHLVTTGADDVDALAAFSHPQGYVYRPDLTTVQDEVETVSMVSVR